MSSCVKCGSVPIYQRFSKPCRHIYCLACVRQIQNLIVSNKTVYNCQVPECNRPILTMSENNSSKQDGIGMNEKDVKNRIYKVHQAEKKMLKSQKEKHDQEMMKGNLMLKAINLAYHDRIVQQEKSKKRHKIRCDLAQRQKFFYLSKIWQHKSILSILIIKEKQVLENNFQLEVSQESPMIRLGPNTTYQIDLVISRKDEIANSLSELIKFMDSQVFVCLYGQTNTGKTTSMMLLLRHIVNQSFIEGHHVFLAAHQFYLSSCFDLIEKDSQKPNPVSQLPDVPTFRVLSIDHFEEIMKKINLNRTTRSNKRNFHSSRSNLLIRLRYDTKVLNIIDLAGKERKSTSLIGMVSESQRKQMKLLDRECDFINTSNFYISSYFSWLRARKPHESNFAFPMDKMLAFMNNKIKNGAKVLLIGTISVLEEDKDKSEQTIKTILNLPDNHGKQKTETAVKNNERRLSSAPQNNISKVKSRQSSSLQKFPTTKNRFQ